MRNGVIKGVFFFFRATIVTEVEGDHAHGPERVEQIRQENVLFEQGYFDPFEERFVDDSEDLHAG